MFKKPSEGLLYRCSSFLSLLLTSAKDCGNFAAKYSMTEYSAVVLKLMGMMNKCDDCGRNNCKKGCEITTQLLKELNEGSEVIFSPDAGGDLKGRKGTVFKKYMSGKIVVQMGSVTTCYSVINDSEKPVFLLSSCQNEKLSGLI